MLTDDCERLTARISEKERLRRHAEQLNKFDKVHAQLAQRAEARLAPLVDCLRALRAAQISTASLAEAARPLLAEVAALLAEVRRDPEAAIDPDRFQVQAFLRRVEAVASRLENELTRSWQAHTATQGVATNRELLDVLGRLPRLQPVVQRIRALVDRLQREQVTLPQNEAAIAAYHQLVAQAQAAWQELGGGEVPAEVLAFLRGAVGSTGARLDQLTERVRQWLTEHKLEGAFAIRAGN